MNRCGVEGPIGSTGFGPGPLVMGILNVTPDSFSDGGRYVDVRAAVKHARRMFSEGAAFIDVGGESTRPGAFRIDAETEARRIGPVVKALAAEGIPSTIDTTRASVAEAALSAGALGVNDVSGGLADGRMAKVVAASDCFWILMHSRAASSVMQNFVDYQSVVRDVSTELRQRVDLALTGGVSEHRLAIDPGLGFSKTAAQNWELIANLETFKATGRPLVVGASRKSFLGTVGRDTGDETRPLAGRRDTTTAVNTLLAIGGVWAIRTHEVRPAIDAIAVANAVRQQLSTP